MCIRMFFCCIWLGDHRDLHVLTHFFPTRRASDLNAIDAVEAANARRRTFTMAATTGEDTPHDGAPTSWSSEIDQLSSGASGAQGHKRSEEHTSELQSLMRNSYAVFCLKKQKVTTIKNTAQYPIPTTTSTEL